MMWKKERTACWVRLDAIKDGSEYSFLPDRIVNQSALLSHFISRDYFHFEVCKFYKGVCCKELDSQGEDYIGCNSLSFPYIQVCVPETRWDPSTKPKEEEQDSAFEETKSTAKVSLAGNIKDGGT